jgi:hypothetical protein
MQQSSWEANSRSLCQHRSLIEPDVHYRVHNSSPLDQTIFWGRSIQSTSSQTSIFKIHFNIIPHVRLRLEVISDLKLLYPAC